MTDYDIDLSVPTATTVVMPPAEKAVLDQQAVTALVEQGYTSGLARELSTNVRSYPIRFWVCDNSGSMRKNDGHSLIGTTSKDDVMVVPSNRWTELAQTINYHAELAGLLEAPTEFRMLNDPGVLAGPQMFSVAERGASFIQADLDIVRNVVQKTQPAGVTPLTYHIMEIRERILILEQSLRSMGQQAVVVLATDGLPTNELGEHTAVVRQEFAQALKSLQSLPVWIVVRLCTDDEDVVEFYNDLDALLELPLEVLDDFFGEAQEIYKCNPFLNYTLPLHRCRELGYHNRVFDLLDERKLNKDELREFLGILFGLGALDGAPDVHTDWSGFLKELELIVNREGKQWNPITKKLSPWIDMKKLRRAYGGGGSFGLFGRRK